MDILLWIAKKLADRGITKYDLVPVMVEVPPSTMVPFAQQNDIYFFSNAFTSLSAPINGNIIGIDNALELTPKFVNSTIYKYQDFTGKILINNLDSTNTMFVEMMIATPKH